VVERVGHTGERSQRKEGLLSRRRENGEPLRARDDAEEEVAVRDVLVERVAGSAGGAVEEPRRREIDPRQRLRPAPQQLCVKCGRMTRRGTEALDCDAQPIDAVAREGEAGLARLYVMQVQPRSLNVRARRS